MTAGTGTPTDPNTPSTPSDNSSTPSDNSSTPTPKSQPTPNPNPNNRGPTGPSAGSNDGDGSGGGSDSTSTSGVTPNIAIMPTVVFGGRQPGGGYFIGFTPITNQAFSHTQTTSVGCTPGNNGRAGNNRTVTRTSTSSVQRNYGCTVRLGYTKDDAERDIDYAITAAVDIIDDNPGFRLDLSLNF